MERRGGIHGQNRGEGRSRGRNIYNNYTSTVYQQSRTSPNNNYNSFKSSNPSYNNDNTSSSSKSVEHDDDNDAYIDPIVGTCTFMCPVEEMERRERLRDLAVFERLHGNPGKTTSSLAVKKFCRTISRKNIHSSHVRPLPVLEDTLNHLMDLLDSSEHSFEVLHEFIFDRSRSIRQDLSIQNIVSVQAINIYERLVKFYVLSLHNLQPCIENPEPSPMHHLNMEQLAKALVSLYNLYEANRNLYSIFPNEAEFRSFYVLLHLGSENQTMGDSLCLWFRQVPTPILKSKELLFSRNLLRYMRLGNYKRFISTIEAEASYLQYCIIKPYIEEVRALALSCVNHGGYKLHPYPLIDLSKQLLIKEVDLEAFCTDCGLQTTIDEVGRRFLPTKQTSFVHPKRSLQNHYLLDSERIMMQLAIAFKPSRSQ